MVWGWLEPHAAWKLGTLVTISPEQTPLTVLVNRFMAASKVLGEESVKEPTSQVGADEK